MSPRGPRDGSHGHDRQRRGLRERLRRHAVELVDDRLRRLADADLGPGRPDDHQQQLRDLHGRYAFTTTVHTTGIPTAAITETGALPTGLTFTDNGDGTATIAGTPAAGSGGSYPITITATNSAGTTTQSFVLTNAQAPTITSAATATFSTGVLGSYQVTTTGYPAPAITETGALPLGMSFVDNGNGSATISGTPDPTAPGPTR